MTDHVSADEKGWPTTYPVCGMVAVDYCPNPGCPAKQGGTTEAGAR